MKDEYTRNVTSKGSDNHKTICYHYTRENLDDVK